jgi:hypothetical protein
MKGKKIGFLTVLQKSKQKKYNKIAWDCKCDCGNLTLVTTGHLNSRFVKSCGCLNKPHGMSHTKFHEAWSAMRKRCHLDSRHDFKHYKGRGIKVCKRWLDFINFRDDMFESFQQHIEKFGVSNTSLDRIDNNNGYCKENCKWSTRKEQAINRSTTRWIEFNGEKKTLTDWADDIGMSVTGLADRFKAGWSVEKALTTRRIKQEYAEKFIKN